jgi:hypothetical protein
VIPRTLTLAVLACAALTASAQSPAPSATWFADNPGPRNRILDLCRDHPGPAERDDRCKAAFEGAGIAAAREARRNRGDLTPPTLLKYWFDRPEQRREHLASCSRIPPSMPRLWCTEAEEAERQVQEAERRAGERAQQQNPQPRPPRSAGRT